MPSDGTLSFGVNAAPSAYGQIGHQKSTFGNPGDAQTSQILLMNIINSNSVDDLYSDYPTNSAYIKGPVAAGSIAFSAQLIAQDIATGDTSHFELKATFKSFPSYSLVGFPTIITVGEDIPGAVVPKVLINVTTGEIVVNVGNNHQHSIQCVCYVRYTETWFTI